MIIIGCGYLGQKVASRYLKLNQGVVGVTRGTSVASALTNQGLVEVSVDLDYLPLARIPMAGRSMFYFVPPPGAGRKDTRVRHLIEAFDSQGAPIRLVYLSTTGVYGNCGGDWVTEERTPSPMADRACRRLDAERSLMAACANYGVELVILRVAGIYGPGRLPIERLRNGVYVIREEEAPYTNRIHVDDLVTICMAAMRRGESGGVYNVSDGHPTTMTDYFNKIADLYSLPRPLQIPLSEAPDRLSSGMLSYMRESRRLDNRRMREELQVTLRYPSLESGLRSCLVADT